MCFRLYRYSFENLKLIKFKISIWVINNIDRNDDFVEYLLYFFFFYIYKKIYFLGVFRLIINVVSWVIFNEG